MRGWHVSADKAGCHSVVDLLDRMQEASVASYRTIALTKPSAAISAVPNFGPPARDAPGSMRLVYSPAHQGLTISEEDERLFVTFGRKRLPELKSGFVEIGIGGGDFAVCPDNKKAELPIWFWWMPDYCGNRLAPA